MPIANYSTTVPVRQSIREIEDLLVANGARSILIEYERQGPPSALKFQMPVDGDVVGFALPSNVEGVLAAMKRDKKIPRSKCTEEQAERVAWRILREWLRAQLAIIASGLIKFEHVMLPYALTQDGRTLAQAFEDRGGRQMLRLEAGR